MQLIFFSLYLQGMFIVPSCLITEPPYAERTASFFSSASGFSGAVMRSSLIGKTLLCAPVSILHCRLIFRFFLAELSQVMQRLHCVCRVWNVGCLLCVNLDGTDCRNFLIFLVAPVLNRVNYFFEGRFSSLVKLSPFAGSADRLPMISFAAFST